MFLVGSVVGAEFWEMINFSVGLISGFLVRELVEFIQAKKEKRG